MMGYDLIDIISMILLCMLAVGILIIAISFSIKIIYGIELTPEQIADERKTQICIIYNISNEECFLVYGDVDNDWEPPK